ncbi:MAG: flagellar protein FlaG [Nitrospirae bacterium]|nr:flagellar protein FlaG [Nitrospirota bacterium]
MAQRIEAAKAAIGPAIQPRPAVNLGGDTVALDPAQAVQSNMGESGSHGELAQDQRPNIEPVEKGEEDDAALNDARRTLGLVGRDVRFSVDRDTGALVVQIRDPESGKVERQIPQDQILKMHEQIQKIAGLLFHQAA